MFCIGPGTLTRAGNGLLESSRDKPFEFQLTWLEGNITQGIGGVGRFAVSNVRKLKSTLVWLRHYN
jgi:hypothetical protein